MSTTVYIPTPVTAKPEKSGWYHVITTSGILSAREYYAKDDDWEGYTDTAFWFKLVTVEGMPDDEAIDAEHFVTGPAFRPGMEMRLVRSAVKSFRDRYALPAIAAEKAEKEAAQAKAMKVSLVAKKQLDRIAELEEALRKAVNSDLSTLIVAAAFFSAAEDHQNFTKLKGRPHPGGECKITWNDREANDYGYFFRIPGIHDLGSVDGDVFVHVPRPDNSDGIDDAPEQFMHLNDLLANERVKQVRCLLPNVR